MLRHENIRQSAELTISWLCLVSGNASVWSRFSPWYAELHTCLSAQYSSTTPPNCYYKNYPGYRYKFVVFVDILRVIIQSIMYPLCCDKYPGPFHYHSYPSSPVTFDPYSIGSSQWRPRLNSPLPYNVWRCLSSYENHKQPLWPTGFYCIRLLQ